MQILFMLIYRICGLVAKHIQIYISNNLTFTFTYKNSREFIGISYNKGEHNEHIDNNNIFVVTFNLILNVSDSYLAMILLES